MLIWLLYTVADCLANQEPANSDALDCMDTFRQNYFQAPLQSIHPEAGCVVVYRMALPCFQTREQKLAFVDDFESGKCSYLKHIMPNLSPRVTPRGLADWIDSLPAQRKSLPEVMQNVWSYHATKLKGTKHKDFYREAVALSHHYNRRAQDVLDTSSVAVRGWAGGIAILIPIVLYHIYG